jgi:hypothetical protein
MIQSLMGLCREEKFNLDEITGFNLLEGKMCYLSFYSINKRTVPQVL